uniref:Acetyl-CoA acetyltransferase n=1 Tax=Parastrongyloides trichosuri TaxID=131310 RepID=A0A0N4Z2S9_PARTI
MATFGTDTKDLGVKRTMTDAFIYDHVRTPRGRALRDRNGIDTAKVDDIIFGCVDPVGEAGAVIPRSSAFEAGYDFKAPGMQISRFCASGLDAVNLAAAKIAGGTDELVIAGGVESMSRVGMGMSGGAWYMDPSVGFPGWFMPQGVSADLIATKYGFSREDVDAYAVESQRRAGESWKKGYFKNSVIPIKDINGLTILDHDEHMRPTTDLAALSGLNPSFVMPGEMGGFNAVGIQAHPEVETINHVHHAGNSSGIVDGAAGVLVGSKRAGKMLDIKPRARIRAFTNIGSEPALMLTGPVDVTEKLLERAKMKLSDIDLFELNEAFAAVVLRYMQAFNIPHSKINVNGGAIAMGHPLGATGAMILGTVLDELERRDLNTALVTLCIGAGMGTATIIELETGADGIAVVTWNMPDKSMNVLTEEVLTELDKIIDQVVSDNTIKGAVITSGKDTFSGGADLTMMQKMLSVFKKEQKQDAEKAVQNLFDNVGRMTGLYRKLETCGKPWVSAINGTCMGGALELSLACHGRVVSDAEGVKLALPEVKVGLFPGAGGTQRVPRLVNSQDALQMMTTGSSLTAARAKGMGLVHEVAPAKKLVETAKKMIRNGLKPVQPWDEKGFKLPGGAIYSAAGANLWPAATAILRRETSGNYPAALTILKCVYEGLLVPFDTDHRSAVDDPLAFRIFAGAEQRRTSPGRHQANQVQENRRDRCRFHGRRYSGFMGAGIAYVTAKAGIPVVLIDRNLEAAEKGKAHSADLIAKEMQKGRMTAEDKDKLLALITPSADYAALDGADMVIEAVFEDRGVKQAATEQAEAVLGQNAVFASNTSTLPITGLAKVSQRPKNFIGIHFFSPVDKMMLVEVIMGKKTGEKALATALDYVRAIKKTPIVVNDTRGFYVNRCVLRYMSEAYNMLVEGVPPAMIENA